MPPVDPTITPPRARRVLPRWWGLVAAVALLVATNVLVGVVWPAWAVPWKVVVTALLLVLARVCGLGWDDLGLARRHLGTSCRLWA
ncbi:hypothetical protein ACQP04_13770 [Pseudonocardia halophobica]|uniref:hypothetical protein n=1 Tax=Pseudonocardia halophobica TaxID=29401 RepID=UPI003D8C17E2